SKMPHSRYAFKFAILPNGNVLAICGNWSQGVNAVDLYVPASNSWRRAGGIPARTHFSAVRLDDGDVLVPGGLGNTAIFKTAYRSHFPPYRSTAIATALPPPRQSAAIPRWTSRRIIS